MPNDKKKQIRIIMNSNKSHFYTLVLLYLVILIVCPMIFQHTISLAQEINLAMQINESKDELSMQTRNKNIINDSINKKFMTNKKTYRGLLLTGNDHPAHKWQETTPEIKKSLEEHPNIHIDVTENIEDLSRVSKETYSFLVLHYCNWKDPKGLSGKAKESFVTYLKEGGGLLILHLSNGAFHYSLPGAGESDWPEYRNICRRVWDHHGGSAHDNYDQFKVEIVDTTHFITNGLASFNTKDELYYNQAGTKPIEPLIQAKSIKTGQYEPLAWVYTYGKGKIFQSLLGHSAESYQAEEVREMLKRAAVWVSQN